MSYIGNRDWMLEIPKGTIPKHSSVNKFGAIDAAAADTQSDIWDGGGTYTWPTTADITHISQATDQVGTDANATIQVEGLDTNWAPVTQTVDLDGTDTTTAVALGTALKRVFRMKCLENIVLADDVSVHNVGDTTDYAIIVAGNNQTEMALYTVPAGYTAYITSYYGDYAKVTNKDPTSLNFALWFADRGNSYEFQLKHEVGIQQLGPSFQHFFRPYLAVPAQTDIKLTILPHDDPAHAHGGFDIILVED